ncbi:uracil-DNA glycosylase family protein [Paenibacillus sp. NRS-1760]|uniref:uracil-DNA glycosylase family protein n=1 Tax=Paenibacillus sp. NRS-1760 TaxID=3233902 RepID=UPI003D2E1B28
MLKQYIELLKQFKNFTFDFAQYEEETRATEYGMYHFVNPLDNYWREHINFLNRYYSNECSRNIIMGLNPGKDGCNKTSVAFTDPTAARDILRMNLPFDPIREPSSEKLYPIFLQEFNNDISEFFNHYHLTNLLPYGVTKLGIVEQINVKFDKIISIPRFNEFASLHVHGLIDLFNPKFIIAVGLDVQKFLRNILKNDYPDVIIIPAVHPAYNTHFTDVEKKRWGNILRTFK